MQQKSRIEGRVRNALYEIVAADGGVIKEIPLGDARADSRLAAAIARNGWEKIPEA